MDIDQKYSIEESDIIKDVQFRRRLVLIDYLLNFIFPIVFLVILITN